jgi:glutaredoxin
MKYTLLVKRHCPYCISAIEMLSNNMTKKDTIIVKYESEDFEDSDYKKKFGNNATYPRIYFGKKYIGGHDDLVELLRK